MSKNNKFNTLAPKVINAGKWIVIAAISGYATTLLVLPGILSAVNKHKWRRATHITDQAYTDTTYQR